MVSKVHNYLTETQDIANVVILSYRSTTIFATGADTFCD